MFHWEKVENMVDRRVFLIVLDSYGIGELPDAATFGDAGCNTLRSIVASKEYDTPLMRIGKPIDIARCALFLANEGGDFITGQVISSNGGFVIN